jgi:hypothetical protein
MLIGSNSFFLQPAFSVDMGLSALPPAQRLGTFSDSKLSDSKVRVFGVRLIHILYELTGVEEVHPLASIARIELGSAFELVVAIAAYESVTAPSAKELVFTILATENIVANPPIEQISAGPAKDTVITAVTADYVLSPFAIDAIISLSAINYIITFCTFDLTRVRRNSKTCGVLPGLIIGCYRLDITRHTYQQ